MQKTYIKQIAAFFIGLAAIILTVISGAGFAFAADIGSNVLNDLSTDSSFNAAAYPKISGDYSLNVIQIAESTNGELLIYVYQPSGELKASSINISRYPDSTLKTSFLNYKLEYLNSSDTLYKYKVVGFELLKNAQRNYNISNILRPFDKQIDQKPGNDNTVSEVKNAVGQCWTATTVIGSVTYSMTYSEVIEIQNKYVGYVNYNDGTNLGWAITSGATSAHFVAFSTDKPIDKLISASLTFNERNVTYKQCCNVVHLQHTLNSKFDYQYGEKTAHDPNPLTLHYTDKASNPGGGSIKPGNSYTWDRIQTTSEFLADKDETGFTFTKEGTGGFNNTKWVLNFYETSVNAKVDNVWTPLISWVALPFVGDVDVKITEVSDVMILQLEFETDGKTYKLGAIDNKQSGSQKPVGDNFPRNDDGLQWWAYALIVIAALIGFVIIVKLISRFFSKRSKRKEAAASKSKAKRSKTSRGRNSRRNKKQ